MEASTKNSSLIIERSSPTVVLPEQETQKGSIFLSSLEKMSPLMVRSIYSFDKSDANVVDVIKQALAKVLVHYHPLAGRLAKNSQGKLFVHCQKKLGVPFVEAMTNSEIESLGDSRLVDSDVLDKLVYKDPMEDILEAAPLLTAQVTSTCTSFEALAAFVWRVRSMALKMKLHQQLKLHLAVNFRSRLTAPLPEGYFGNAVVFPCCLCTMGELIEEPLSASVKRIKKIIESVNGYYVQSRIDYYDINTFEQHPVGRLLISSWTRLEYGSTDFGWGEPRFGAGKPPRETCLFMKDGRKKGIVAVLGLPLSAMNTFEKLVCDLNDA